VFGFSRQTGESEMKTKPRRVRNAIPVWRFVAGNARLMFGDDRKVQAGKELMVKGPPSLCSWGFHGSRTLRDALHWQGSRVRLTSSLIGGVVQEDTTKICGTKVYTEKILTEHQTEYFLARWALECVKRSSHLIFDPEVRDIYHDILAKAEKALLGDRGWRGKLDDLHNELQERMVDVDIPIEDCGNCPTRHRNRKALIQFRARVAILEFLDGYISVSVAVDRSMEAVAWNGTRRYPTKKYMELVDQERNAHETIANDLWFDLHGEE
jgi:hypothetical protein